MKLLEWNLHKMTKDMLVKTFVVDAILEANADFGAVDHVLHSKGMVVNSAYKWDYLSADSVYPCFDDIKKGKTWDIPVAYPDHALMISDIELNDIG